jgi:hypothetical protein
MTADEFAALALELPDAVEGAHFGKRDFRAGKIFASLPRLAQAALNFSPDQQAMMLEMHGALFSAIQNAWGAKGWTHLDIAACPPDIARSALSMAWENATAKKAARKAR